MLLSSPSKSCLCIVYISVSQPKIINDLVSIVKNNLLHTFEDQIYNRTSFYLSGPNVVDTVSNLCKNAFMLLDHRSHEGTHPTLGSIDNICFSPLSKDMTLTEVATIANEFSKILSEQEHIQVYNYAEASLSKHRLQNIRRELGYFDKTPSATMPVAIKISTEPSVNSTIPSTIVPDYGREHVYNPKKGITCVGAIPLILNYNLRFRPEDSRSLVLQVTKKIRAPDVEALTLQHEEGSYEVACNLLNSKYGTTPEMLLAKAKLISQELSIQIVKAYTTGPTEDELLDKLTASLIVHNKQIL